MFIEWTHELRERGMGGFGGYVNKWKHVFCYLIVGYFLSIYIHAHIYIRIYMYMSL